MKQRQITVKRDCVLVEKSEVLKNYWYKYIIHIIQMVLVEEESRLVALVGESSFENFYDLIEECSAEANGGDFKDLVVPEKIENIGDRIEAAVIGEKDMFWDICNIACSISVEQILVWTDQYFCDLILPYIQLAKDNEVIIKSSFDCTKTLFEMQIRKNGYTCASSTSNENSIIKIELIKEDNELVKWSSEEDRFSIVNDMNECIPVDSRITLSNLDYIEHTINVFFPFYKKGDSVIISLNNTGNRWIILAENENNNIKYASGIKL